MNHFDQSAATWDAESMHQERTNAIAKEIANIVPLQSEWKILEFGAGTGALSFLLKDTVKEISMLDISTEMVNVMKQKVRDLGSSRLKPVLLDLEKEDYSGELRNMIMTSMAFHHVHNIPLLISKFYQMLTQDGYAVIADLYSEDGSFHGSGFDGHNGFDPNELGQQFIDAGFVAFSAKECYVIHKKTENGEWKDFPVFLLVVRK